MLAKSGTDTWKGHLNGQIGYFKTILTEEVALKSNNSRLQSTTSRSSKRYGITQGENFHPNSWITRPGAFREILIKFDLAHLTQVS